MVFSQNYRLEVHQEQNDLKEIIGLDKKNNSFKKEFELLKSTSNNQMEFRYLVTSRAGIIKVNLEKENSSIKVLIKEAPMGFFLPTVFLLGSLGMYFLENMAASLFLLGGAFVFLLFIYANFIYYSNKIKDSIKKIIS